MLATTQVNQSPTVAIEATRSRKTLTVEEFAKLAGIHRGRAYDGVRRGTIPHVRVGRRILIPADALDRMFDRAGEVA